MKFSLVVSHFNMVKSFSSYPFINFLIFLFISVEHQIMNYQQNKWLVVIVWLFLPLSCATVPAGFEVYPENNSLLLRINKITERAHCRLGVAAYHIESGWRFEWRGQEKFEAASVIKIAVLAEAVTRYGEGRLDLTERWTLTNEAKAAGSGILDACEPGLQPTKLDLLRLMIIVSDNTAANYWIDCLGMDEINKRMESLGLSGIRIFNRMPDMNPKETEAKRWEGLKLGEATPHDFAGYFRMLAEGRLFTEKGTMLAHEIFSQQHFSRIPKRLLRGKERTWEGKTGTMGRTRIDTGLLTTPKGHFTISIIADQIPDGKEAEDAATEAISDVAYEIVTAWENMLPELVQ